MQRPSKFPKTKRTPTIFNRIEEEIAVLEAQGRKIHAMHVGDTHFDFPQPMLEPVPDEEKLFGSRLNIYGNTYGEKPLREALLEKVKTRNHLPVEDIDNIQITNGSTGALAACFSRLIEPGAELLVISPYWTILRQVADQAQLQIIEVPLFDKIAENDDYDISALLEEYGGPWCKGIYINTPSNPTGMLLKEKHLNSLAEFAKKRDLWVFSDEAYEDFIYDGQKHVSIGSLPGMFDRTVSIYTFSKNFGASGIRIGYAAGLQSVIGELNRGVVGSCYHPGRYDQLMAWRGLKNFEKCLNPIYEDYKAHWEYARSNLKTRFMPVSGSFYFYIWLGEDWINGASEIKIKRMLKSGVVMSPGESFGSEYRGWARMCFTILPMNELIDAVSKINKMLGC